MILNDELLKKSIHRINELQEEITKNADSIKGSEEYIKQQLDLFKEAEKHRKILNSITHKQEELSSTFVE